MRNMTLRMLAVDQLDPNPWNPNRGKRNPELVAEVRRRGEIHKPIVVRRKGDRFEIIDGEQTWRAACEVGLLEVVCEVIEADDFEAMRQNYKRDQHGRHCPVREGRMFLAMMRARHLSIRQLAKELGVSEATIRNSLLYAKVAEARSRHAGENRDDEISKLSHRKVRLYSQIPSPINDIWLDGGGGEGIARFVKDGTLKSLQEFSLLDVVPPQPQEIIGALQRVAELVAWVRKHIAAFPNAAEYARHVIDLQLPAWTLSELVAVRDGERVDMVLTPEEWRQLLEQVKDEASNPQRLFDAIDLQTRRICREAGLEAGEVFRGPTLEELIASPPEFLEDASHLTLDDQAEIQRFAPLHTTEEEKREVIRRACSRVLREIQEGPDGQREPGSMTRTLWECMTGVLAEAKLSGGAGRLESPEGLRDAIVRRLRRSPALQEARVGQLDALEVLVEQLEAANTPEFPLWLAALICGDDAQILKVLCRWKARVCGVAAQGAVGPKADEVGVTAAEHGPKSS